MTNPTFILPAGYESRPMRLVLAPVMVPIGRGNAKRRWRFYGRDAQGYCVPARMSASVNHAPWPDFTSRQDAADSAFGRGAPPYAIFVPQRRGYRDADLAAAFEVIASPRDQISSPPVRFVLTLERGERMRVDEFGYISRPALGMFEPSRQWKALALVRYNNFGRVAGTIPFSDWQRIARDQAFQWRHANGSCRWHVRDLDHGTIREQGEGVSSIRVGEFTRQVDGSYHPRLCA